MLRNDLKRNGIGILKSFIIFLIMVGFLTGFSLVLGEMFENLRLLVETWPVELVALGGIGNIFAKHGSLMIFYMVMTLFNMAAMVICVSSVVNIIKMDEKKSLVKFYINQPYTRNQIFGSKLIMTVLSALMQWFLYIGLIYAAVGIICRQLGLAFEQESVDIVNIGLKGTIFLLFYLALTLFYSMFDNAGMSYGSFMSIIIFVIFMLGNAYKVLDLIAYYIRAAQGNIELVGKIGEWLEYLRILFPFTLLNALNEEAQPLPEYVYGVYGGLAVVLLALSWYRYSRKALG